MILAEEQAGLCYGGLIAGGLEERKCCLGSLNCLRMVREVLLYTEFEKLGGPLSGRIGGLRTGPWRVQA